MRALLLAVCALLRSSLALTISMGVSVQTSKPGNGKVFPKAGQMVRAHYTGKLRDGTVFDTSRGFLKQPFQFQIGAGEVIKGWDVGIMKMSVGEKAVLTCSSDYGYGMRGAPPDIPPNAELIFDVELVSVSGKPFF